LTEFQRFVMLAATGWGMLKRGEADGVLAFTQWSKVFGGQRR